MSLKCAVFEEDRQSSKPAGITQQRRLAAYIEGLANGAGHADRHTPLKNYCTGLLLPGERKSVEPRAARLAPDNVRRMHRIGTHQMFFPGHRTTIHQTVNGVVTQR
jgi:hypothetical protein